MRQDRPAPAAPLRDEDLDDALAEAGRLVTRAEARAAALAELGDLPWPGPVANETDQAHLRAVAVLYLAAELEAAGLVPTAETLAGLAISGGLPVDLGDATDLVASFWRNRHERFSETERRALFDRLFGAGSGDGEPFELLLIDLCGSLYHLADGLQPGSPAPVNRLVGVRTHARALADHLLTHSGTISAFAARDLLEVVRTALAILTHPRVMAAFLARTPWDVIRSLAQRLHSPDPRTGPHLRRARAGMRILNWLADALPALADASAFRLAPDDPVIAAAGEWIEESLALSEEPAAQVAA
jgi:hypothetical protein